MEDESGIGYLMRVARHNGMSLATMLEWLDLGSPHVLNMQAAQLLAYVCNVPRSWVAERMVIARRRSANQSFDWLGFSWASAGSLRGKHPQICPECLKAGAWCRFEWDATGVCACRHHGCYLIDRCGYCRQPLVWERPAVDVCRCGHYLAQARSVAAIPKVLRWVRLIHGAMLGATVTLAEEDQLPRWLRPLSPDGMYSIVCAFGGKVPALGSLLAANATAPCPETIAQVMVKGLEQLQDVGDCESRCPRELRELVHEETLERLAKRGAIEADRDIANALVTWLRNVPRTGRSVTGRRARGQLDLFR
jgi:hypothetical protein